MKSKLLSVLIVVILCNNLYAQKAENKETPKELMSSYYQDNFQPFSKSNWMVSFNMALKKEEFENEDRNFENILNGDSRSSSFEIATAYFFSDNFAGKLGFGIKNDEFKGRILKTLDTVNRISTEKIFSVGPSLRSVLPLSANNRLSLYIDLSLIFGWGNTELENTGILGITEYSERKNFEFSAGVNSGITFFAMESFAIEIGLDILSYKYTSSTTNNFGEPESKYKNEQIDFSIDLLTLNLALTYYFGSKKNKER